MNTPAEIPMRELVEALLDESKPFQPRYLYRLSDLVDEDLALFQESWPRVSVWRRQALLEDVEELGETDYLLDFQALSRLALLDSEPRVRDLAVRILWEYETPDLAPVFLNLLENDADITVRADAATALGRFVYLGEVEDIPETLLHEIEDVLIRVFQGNDDALVRRHALESLGFSSRAEIGPLIEQSFHSRDTGWVASALYAMGRSADEEWSEQVLSMLDHTIPAVRAEAARAAGELEISEAARSLIEMLDDPNDQVRSAAIWSLSQIGGEGVRERLEKIHEETEDDEEADYIESALDNLAFTEELGLFSMFDFPSGQENKKIVNQEKAFLDQYSELDDDALVDIEDFDDEDVDLEEEPSDEELDFEEEDIDEDYDSSDED